MEGASMQPLVPQNNESGFSQEQLLTIEKLKDPAYLPSLAELELVFKQHASQAYTEKKFEDSPFKKTSELFRQYEGGKGIFESLGRKYEIWNKEYIDHFSDYLAKRILDMHPNDKAVILEVAAGNGTLSYFLKRSLDEKIPGRFDIIATDSGDWNIKHVSGVEVIDYKEALVKYKPDIILTSWMPMNEDFTQAYRDCPSVKEYILIGNTIDTGSKKTWGGKHPNIETTSEFKARVKDLVMDGFVHNESEEVSGLAKFQNVKGYINDRPSTESFIRKTELV